MSVVYCTRKLSNCTPTPRPPPLGRRHENWNDTSSTTEDDARSDARRPPCVASGACRGNLQAKSVHSGAEDSVTTHFAAMVAPSLSSSSSSASSPVCSACVGDVQRVVRTTTVTLFVAALVLARWFSRRCRRRRITDVASSLTLTRLQERLWCGAARAASKKSRLSVSTNERTTEPSSTDHQRTKLGGCKQGS